MVFFCLPLAILPYVLVSVSLFKKIHSNGNIHIPQKNECYLPENKKLFSNQRLSLLLVLTQMP